MPGTYLVEQDDGTQSLWTLSKHGDVQITSSAEAELQFSHEQGVWKPSSARTARVTTIDFSFGPRVNGGVAPLSIARVDALLTFFEACHRVEAKVPREFPGFWVVTPCVFKRRGVLSVGLCSHV